MDEYGIYNDSEEDIKSLADALKENGTIVFSYSADKTTAFIVLISQSFAKLGIMPFGGNPSGRFYVGIYGRGCSHLSFKNESVGYISEKLGVGEHSAEHLQWLFYGIGCLTNP